MMDDLPSFDAACAMMRDMGFTLEEAPSTPQAFGSWYVRAQANGKLVRLMWDGREGALVIQEPSPSGVPNDWADRWIAGTGYRNKAADLREGLLKVLA